MPVIGVDIDGVLCSEERTFEKTLAVPLEGARDALVDLAAAGNVIVLYSARGWEYYAATVAWLRKHEMPYDQLILGKPIFDFFIDDRAISHVSWNQTRKSLASLGVLTE